MCTKHATFAKNLLAMLFALAAVSAATAQQPPQLKLQPPTLEPTIKVFPTPKLQPSNPATCICTTQYDPVCGRMPNGTRLTFSNACNARCAGVTIIARGRC